MRLGANGRGCIGVVWVWLRALTRFFIPASWWSCRPRTRSSDLGRRSARNAGRKAWRRLLARRRSVRLRLNCVCVPAGSCGFPSHPRTRRGRRVRQQAACCAALHALSTLQGRHRPTPSEASSRIQIDPGLHGSGVLDTDRVCGAAYCVLSGPAFSPSSTLNVERAVDGPPGTSRSARPALSCTATGF